MVTTGAKINNKEFLLTTLRKTSNIKCIMCLKNIRMKGKSGFCSACQDACRKLNKNALIYILDKRIKYEIELDNISKKYLNLEFAEHIKIRERRRKSLTIRKCIICGGNHKKAEASPKCKRCSARGKRLSLIGIKKHMESKK